MENAPTTPEAEKQRERREFQEAVAEIATRLHELDHSYDARRVLAVLNALRDDRGSITPAEEFIGSILGTYAHHGALTPEDVEEDLKAFRESFTDSIENARRLLKQHPDQFTAAPAAPWRGSNRPHRPGPPPLVARAALPAKHPPIPRRPRLC